MSKFLVQGNLTDSEDAVVIYFGASQEAANNATASALETGAYSSTEQFRLFGGVRKQADPLVVMAFREKVKAEENRLTAEAEAKRIADEAEAKRIADEAEAKRIADEAEAKRIADEAEAKRIADEAEAKRIADEAEVKAAKKK